MHDGKHLEFQEEILPNGVDTVDSYTTESIVLQDNVHKEYEKSSIDKNLSRHLCLTTRKDEHIISTDRGGPKKLE